MQAKQRFAALDPDRLRNLADAQALERNRREHVPILDGDAAERRRSCGRRCSGAVGSPGPRLFADRTHERPRRRRQLPGSGFDAGGGGVRMSRDTEGQAVGGGREGGVRARMLRCHC